MNDSSLDMLSPIGLARLLELEPVDAGWSAADAAAALAHQLDTTLLPDLLAAPGAEVSRIAAQRIAGKSPTECTFLEALTTAHPAEQLLKDMKAWAKHIRGIASHPLANGPATVLYYAAIAAALAHAGTKITALSDDQLREGFTWACRQGGAERLVPLLDEVLRKIKE